ncbi:MAG: cyclic nucleotide-binding domain-containing protein, partial [Gammaproteobacteria bacterium]
MANKGEAARDAARPSGAGILEAVHEALDANVAFSDLLSTGDRQFLLDHGVVRRALPGERLCEQNQRDNRVYIIVVGEVEVTESVDGDVVHLASLGRGELFG